MKLWHKLLSSTALVLLAACAQLQPVAAPTPGASASAAAQRPTPLILISIDGFRPDYLTRGVTPVLSRLAQSGVLAAQGMRPSFPSLTFPNHYTLVTGLTPDHHGVINNTMTDEKIPDVVFSLSNRAALADRRWWAETWADRITVTALADRARELGLAGQEELEEIGRAWLRWAEEPDGWFSMIHGEVLCRPG